MLQMSAGMHRMQPWCGGAQGSADEQLVQPFCHDGRVLHGPRKHSVM